MKGSGSFLGRLRRVRSVDLPRVCRPPTLALLALFVLITGCCSVSIGAAGYQRRCVPSPFGKGRIGPSPDRAMAKRQRPAVRWQPELGVYVLIDFPCHWVRLGSYFRLTDGQWSRAPSIDGPWSNLAPSELPGRLYTVETC